MRGYGGYERSTYPIDGVLKGGLISGNIETTVNLSARLVQAGGLGNGVGRVNVESNLLAD